MAIWRAVSSRFSPCSCSVVGAVVAEFVNADRGLGYLIVTSTAFFKVPLAWGALVLLSIVLGVRIVPQGNKSVVQRLGKYHKTLGPGLNIIMPYIDSVAYKVSTKDIVMDIPSQEVITRDNAVIRTNAVAFIKVTDPVKAVYGVGKLFEEISTAVVPLIS